MLQRYLNIEAVDKYFKDINSWNGTIKVCDFIRKVPEKDFKRTLLNELMHKLNNKNILDESDEKYSHLIFILLDEVYGNDSYEVLKHAYFGLSNNWYHPYILSTMCSYVMNLCVNVADMVYLYFGSTKMSEESASQFFSNHTTLQMDYITAQGYRIFTGISKDTLRRNAFAFIPEDKFDIFYTTFKEHFNNEYHIFGLLLE